MPIDDLVSKIIVEDQFTAQFDEYDKRVGGAEESSRKFGASLDNLAVTGGVVVGALTAAGVAVDRLAQFAIDAERSQTNLAIAVGAARQEFGDGVGNIEGWQETIGNLGRELRIFSDQELTGATTRLIDMTKRLGLSEQQMQTVLRRTADLSAGKTDLNDGIERVTAALRGEAEAAEFLGLSLNENTIRAYAESQGLVFSELTDGEKAQLRYAVLLEQTNSLQGRAAALAETAAGKEAEAAAVRERTAATLGQQVLPVYQGWLNLQTQAVEAVGSSGGIVTNVLAAIAASYVAFGATATTVIEAQIERVTAYAGALQAAYEAVRSGSNPFTAVQESLAQANEAGARGANAILNYGDTWRSAFDQIRAGYEGIGQTQTEFTAATGDSEAAAIDLGKTVAQTANDAADAWEKAKQKQVDITDTYNDRVAAAEFQHAQRMAQLQQDLARTVQQAAADAAQARIEAAQELAGSIARVQQDAARDQVDAERQLQQSLRDLAGRRSDAERDTARAIRDINRDLAQDIEQVEYDLANDRAGLVAKTESDILRTQQDFANKRVRAQQEYQDAVNRINSDFERDFAEADPFRRKILEFNRQEQLTQLEAQKNDELAALSEQEQQAVAAIQTKADAELAVLEEAARRKVEIAQREAAEQRQAQQEQLQSTLDNLARRKAALEEEYAYEQQRRQEDAAQAIAQLQQRHAEELVKIDEQQAAKVARAQQALVNEQEQQRQRLDRLRFGLSQELTANTEALREIENERRASYARQLADAVRFQAQMAALGVASPGSVAMNAMGGSVTNNYVNVQSGGGTGYGESLRTGRTVADALRGF